MALVSQEGKLTPLDYCSDYPEMAEYLRSKGAMLGAELYPPQVRYIITV